MCFWQVCLSVYFFSDSFQMLLSVRKTGGDVHKQNITSPISRDSIVRPVRARAIFRPTGANALGPQA